MKEIGDQIPQQNLVNLLVESGQAWAHYAEVRKHRGGIPVVNSQLYEREITILEAIDRSIEPLRLSPYYFMKETLDHKIISIEVGQRYYTRLGQGFIHGRPESYEENGFVGDGIDHHGSAQVTIYKFPAYHHDKI